MAVKYKSIVKKYGSQKYPEYGWELMESSASGKNFRSTGYGSGGYATREAAKERGDKSAAQHNADMRSTTYMRNPRTIITDAHGLARLMRNPSVRRRVKNISEGATVGTGSGRRFLPFREAGDYDPSRLSKRSLAHETADVRSEFDPEYRKRMAAKRKKAVKKATVKKAVKKATKKVSRKPAAKKRRRANPGVFLLSKSGRTFNTLGKARVEAKKESKMYGETYIENAVTGQRLERWKPIPGTRKYKSQAMFGSFEN